MPYPQTPWTLQGYAIQTLHLINTNRVRHLMPTDLEIISVLPGKTFGGVYLSYYGSGSVLEYSELIVIPAFVRHQGKIGGWVSHIYVDSIDSVAGGRDIWGLPKELAQFTWEGERVTVRQENSVLCSLNYKRQTLAWRQWFAGTSFSTKDVDLLMFSAELNSRLGLIGSKLEVPTESSFSALGLGKPLLTIRCEEMSLRVDAPQVVGQTAVKFNRELAFIPAE